MKQNLTVLRKLLKKDKCIRHLETRIENKKTIEDIEEIDQINQIQIDPKHIDQIKLIKLIIIQDIKIKMIKI